MLKILFVTCLLLPLNAASEDGTVFEYDPDDFDYRIKSMKGNFVMFYAPWCRHCTEFHPIWTELGELINSKNYQIAIAQVDCTKHVKLCNENDITGYPTLLYYHKNSFSPVEYKGTRDLPSLTFFLTQVYSRKLEENVKVSTEVEIFSGMAYLNDHNIEKFVSKGQHFILFYVPWCSASQMLLPSSMIIYGMLDLSTGRATWKFNWQRQDCIPEKLAVMWAELGKQYANNEYLQIGRIDCQENEMTCKNFDIRQYPFLLWIVNGRIMGRADVETLADLQEYVEKMLLAENHDPEKFMKKKKALPVARITEETFETFLENDLVYVNYFAPWCAHCMQLSPLWLKLGERFQNESRVIIADIDCGRSKTICEVEKINGLPTLILYKNKNIMNIEHGGMPLESLITLVNEHLEDTKSSDEKESIEMTEETLQSKDEL